MSACWQPGDAVVWRSRLYGRVGYVLPASVVVDTPAFTVLYQAPGSVCKRAAGRRGGPHGRNLIVADWDGNHEPGLARAADPAPAPPRQRLRDHPPLEPGGRPRRGLVPQPGGALAADAARLRQRGPGARHHRSRRPQHLGLEGRGRVGWCIDVGRFSPAQAAAIRAAGLRAIVELEADAWPFTVDWAAWRPNPAWPIPLAPAGWGTEDLDRHEEAMSMADLAVKTLAGTRGQARVGRIEDWRASPASLDLVLSRLALHYVADLPAVCAQAFAALRSGGRFLHSRRRSVRLFCALRSALCAYERTSSSRISALLTGKPPVYHALLGAGSV